MTQFVENMVIKPGVAFTLSHMSVFLLLRSDIPLHSLSWLSLCVMTFTNFPKAFAIPQGEVALNDTDQNIFYSFSKD